MVHANIRIYLYTWFNKLKRSNKNKSNANNKKPKKTFKSLIKNKFKPDLNKNNNNNTNINLTKSSFRFVCMLGSGQFGEVYLGEHLLNGNQFQAVVSEASSTGVSFYNPV